MSGPMDGSRSCKPTPASSVTAVTTPPTGETSPAGHAQQRQRLHPRAVHDPCGRGRAAAQRASRPQRHADVRQPVRHRSVVAPRARRLSGCSTGVRQGQPLGALLGFRLERGLHDTELDVAIAALARAGAAGGAAARRRRRRHRGHRGQQRGGRARRSRSCGRATSRRSSLRRSPTTPAAAHD